MNKEIKTITTNRKAFHDYFIEIEYIAGVVLKGCEIKSIRSGETNLTDGYCVFQNGELWLKNMYIKPYSQRDGFTFNIDPNRDRKLLLTKHELRKLQQKVNVKGFTIIPLKIIINQNNLCKIVIGLCKGKHTYDKRQDLKEKDLKREMERNGI